MFCFTQGSTTALQMSDYLMRAHSGFSAIPFSDGLGKTDPLSRIRHRSSAAFVDPRAWSLAATISDDTMAGAYNFGTLTTSLTGNGTTESARYDGGFNTTDWVDYYRFTLGKASDVAVTLANQKIGTTLRLIRDANNNGNVDAGDVIQSATVLANIDGKINLNGLGADTYFIEVANDNRLTSNYQLQVEATAGVSKEPFNVDSNTLGTAISIGGQLNGSRSFQGNVNAVNDPNDYYFFHLDQATDFNAFLFPKSSDANLYLYLDANQNRKIDASELIAFSAQKGTGTEFIDKEILAPGDYYLQVQKPANSGSTDYELLLQGDPISRAQFTLNINELRALEKFDANFWGTDWYKADFYGTVTIEGTKHNFGSYQDRDVLTGLSFSQFVDPNERFINISIEVNDEDATSDDGADIVPGELQILYAEYDIVKNQLTYLGQKAGFAYGEGQSIRLVGETDLENENFGYNSDPFNKNKASIDFTLNYNPIF
jgi:hypothetical protein